MKRTTKAVVVLSLWLVGAAAAQRRHDPLNDTEISELREAAQESDKRLPLYVKFARARIDAIDQLRAAPKAEPDRGIKVRDLLTDFQTIIDELTDNIDDYDSKNVDLRKPLKGIIEANTDFQTKLTALKDAGGPDAREYSFTLQDAMEALNLSLDDAKKTLADQIANKGELKKK